MPVSHGYTAHETDYPLDQTFIYSVKEGLGCSAELLEYAFNSEARYILGFVLGYKAYVGSLLPLFEGLYRLQDYVFGLLHHIHRVIDEFFVPVHLSELYYR